MINHKFAVIGVGKYGGAIARHLAERGAEVYVFDSNEEKIERIKEDVAFAVTMDSTDKKNLIAQNISNVDAAVVSIGENFEATILTAVHMIEIGVKRIIARASGPQQKLILQKLGVHEILTPEKEVAENVTERLLNPNIVSFLQLPDDYEIAEVKVPKNIATRTIDEIDFRNQYELTLVTIKREFIVNKRGESFNEQHTLGVPNSGTQIKDTDNLVLFGTSKAIERFIDVNAG